MAQLIVRKIEDEVVRRLKERAKLHGISAEEEHRRILREALKGKTAERPSLKEYLLHMPNVGSDEVFAHKRDTGRRIVL